MVSSRSVIEPEDLVSWFVPGQISVAGPDPVPHAAVRAGSGPVAGLPGPRALVAVAVLAVLLSPAAAHVVVHGAGAVCAAADAGDAGRPAGLAHVVAAAAGQVAR